MIALLTALLPSVQVLGAWLISRRISWRRHPALITYLLTEALWQPLAWLGVPVDPWSRAFQMAVRTGVVFEILTFARVPVTRRVRQIAVGLAVAACALGVAAVPEMTGVQRVYLFRQYYNVALCATLLWVVIRRWRAPMLECSRHRVYRIGIAAWMTVIAVAGTFVRGGLGYRIFPRTQAVWDAVNLMTYAALVLVIGAMAAAMTASAPRKAAAKVADDWRVRKAAVAGVGRRAA